MEIIVRDKGREWKMQLPEDEYMIDGKKNVPALAAALAEKCVELERRIFAGIVRMWSDEVFFNKEERDRMGIAPKDRSRTRECVFYGLGSVILPSHTYKDKKTGRTFSLLNEMWGMKPRERVQEQVKVHAASLASEYSYRKTADLLDLGIGPTTVFNAVHAVEVPPAQAPAELRQVDTLFVHADEGHGHLQNGKSCQIPLAVVCEGRKEVCKGRHELIGRHICTALHSNELLADVEAYIYANYDLECLKTIYVMGDGANWISKALDDDFPNVVHVHDAYHRMKAMRKVSNLFPRSSVPDRVRTALQDNDSDEFTKIMKDLEAKAGADKKVLKAVTDMERYFTNHWDAIRLSLDDEILGSCTEPLVQHILAARISAVPCGWSIEGLVQIAAIRAFLLNGGEITKLELTDEELARSCRAQCEKLKADFLNGPFNFDIFDSEDTPYDGDSGTCRRIAQISAGGAVLQ